MLSWYDQAGRDLPWRVRAGRADPYRVWLSEVMLQQTTAAAVAPRYRDFLARWPTVAALAAAPREDVLAAWAGLGYYARARNLHAAAQVLAAGGFPATEEGWRALPGVGPYTAAAIAAIACGLPANAVDGNVERVMARLYAVAAPLPGARAELRALAGALVTADRPGDWPQALMDLGATVCTPRKPDCGACPWAEACAARATGAPESYPRKAAKLERPQRYGAVFLLGPPAPSPAKRGDARVMLPARAPAVRETFWLVRRSDKGLLGGMAGLPTTEWRGERCDDAWALEYAPASALWDKVGHVRHVFTHFALTLDVYVGAGEPRGGGWWGDASALPTVFKKAALLGRGR
ncbi:MAG: A/G-specific adenine glycosylase [Hyphomonadaceae bacterium]